MPHETPSPIDLAEPPIAAGGLRWTARAIAIATLLLLACNAGALRDWVEDLAPGPLQLRLSVLVDGWAGAMEGIGLAAPHDRLHARWKALEAARFGKAD